MSNSRFVIPLMIGLLQLGCASKLMIAKSEDGKSTLAGIPVRTPKLVKVTTTTTYELLKGEDEDLARYCTDDIEESLEVLPLGQVYYVNFHPASLGKAEFSINLTDAGSLKSVQLNSTPQLAETVKEISALLGTLLPYALAAPLEEAPDVAEAKAKYCVKVRKSVTFESIPD